RRSRYGRCTRWRIPVVPRPLTRHMVVPWLLPLLVGDAATGQAARGALEPAFSQPDEARVGHRLAIRVGEVGGDAHVDSKRRTCGDMADASLYLQDELSVVPICP